MDRRGPRHVPLPYALHEKLIFYDNSISKSFIRTKSLLAINSNILKQKKITKFGLLLFIPINVHFHNIYNRTLRKTSKFTNLNTTELKKALNKYLFAFISYFCTDIFQKK